MKRKLLLASGCFLLLAGWFSAFFLNSLPQGSTLYILGPTLSLGVGLGIMRKTVGTKLTALTLAFSALLALVVMNQIYPQRSISISAFQKRMQNYGQTEESLTPVGTEISHRNSLTKKELVTLTPAANISLFAELTGQVGMVTADASGNIYASLPNLGAVYQLRDTDRDGTADELNLFHVGMDYPHGLLWEDGKLYVVEPSRILELKDTDQDDQVDQIRIVLDGLPDKESSQLRSLTKGEKDFLYLSDEQTIYRIDLKNSVETISQ